MSFTRLVFFLHILCGIRRSLWVVKHLNGYQMLFHELFPNYNENYIFLLVFTNFAMYQVVSGTAFTLQAFPISMVCCCTVSHIVQYLLSTRCSAIVCFPRLLSGYLDILSGCKNCLSSCLVSCLVAKTVFLAIWEVGLTIYLAHLIEHFVWLYSSGTYAEKFSGKGVCLPIPFSKTRFIIACTTFPSQAPKFLVSVKASIFFL